MTLLRSLSSSGVRLRRASGRRRPGGCLRRAVPRATVSQFTDERTELESILAVGAEHAREVAS